MLTNGIEALITRMRQGKITSTEITEQCLKRIADYDKQGPCLNAITRVNEFAVEQARTMDEQLRSGQVKGPLHGIPILIKDNIDEAGIPNTAGSVCLIGNVPGRDATIVERLKKAGAIIIARANLHEFAIWGETISSLQGQTLNPYDPTRTPGGSSGGTGAGVAAGYAVAGVGTDTVNSVRSPASANALVGLRPTIGLVSRNGIIPYSLTQDTAGPMTCTVADAAIMLDVLAGEDPGDFVTRNSRGNIPQTYSRDLSPDGLQGKRVGVLHSFWGTDQIHSSVNAIMMKALKAIQSSGAELLDIDDCICSEWITSHVSVHLFDLRPDLDSYLEKMAPELPVHSLQEIMDSGHFHPGIGENIRQALTLNRNSPEYARRMAEQEKLRIRIITLMNVQKLDAIVYPHQKRLVVKTGERQVERNGVLAAATGFPSIVAPGGFSAPEPSAPIGIPVGIEFLGRPWSESMLLSMVYAFEQNFPVRQPPAF